MGVSVDRVMGVCHQTNNGDRSALVEKCYSGCLCLLPDTTRKHSKRLYTVSEFFHNVGQPGFERNYLVFIRAHLFTE